ncbi:MAG TPA: YeaH/YhbH family protein [Rhodocyclaceae bacterium]|nr:YeaH/YhbH family protein [Rhodocyclaceae bacterium]
MTARIIDRRFDSKNKSAANRSRFLRRFRAQIRQAVADAVARRSIKEIDKDERIGIPAKDISEPQFAHGQGGRRMRVFPGNDRFARGDHVQRPPEGAAGKGSSASPDGEGTDDFSFTLSKDEFLDIFFDDLALPDLVKKQLARVQEYQRVRAGYTQTGVPTNLSILRSMRGAAGRRIAVAGPYTARIAELEAKLARMLDERDEPDNDIDALRKEIMRLRLRRDAIPFLDTFDLRYSNRVLVPQPSTQAVMVCIMDVSGSMDEQKKLIAKRFFMLLYIFLTRNYESVDVVFIRHHTQAVEVDEDEFFHSRETGGTVVSTALHLMQQIIRERYSSSLWNIYGAQASDGDNWDNDSAPCRSYLGEKILPLVQYFAYVEIADEPQNLWQEYEKLIDGTDNFALQRIRTLEDIYPVFRALFQKRQA